LTSISQNEPSDGFSATIFCLGEKRRSKTCSQKIALDFKMYMNRCTQIHGHSFQGAAATLQNLWRVNNKIRVTYTCSAYSYHEELHKAFGIDVKEDEAQVHPSRFCNRCYLAMKRKSVATSFVPFQWTAHTPGCKVGNNY
jgi:hypothetical protein